jgi:hypothetical protein
MDGDQNLKCAAEEEDSGGEYTDINDILASPSTRIGQNISTQVAN